MSVQLQICTFFAFSLPPNCQIFCVGEYGNFHIFFVLRLTYKVPSPFSGVCSWVYHEITNQK